MAEPSIAELEAELAELEALEAQLARSDEFNVAFEEGDRQASLLSQEAPNTRDPSQATFPTREAQEAQRDSLSQLFSLETFKNLASQLDVVLSSLDPMADPKLTEEQFLRMNAEAKRLMGPEHLEKFLVGIYGRDNVERRGDRVAYRETGDSAPRLFKRPGFQSEDALAASAILTRDLPGTIAEGLMAASGAGLIPALVAGGLGDIAGELKLQQDAGVQLSPEESRNRALTNAAIGMGSSVLGRAAFGAGTAAASPLTSRGIIRSTIRRDPTSLARARKNLALQKRNPGALSPAELSEVEEFLGFEALVRNHPDGAVREAFSQQERLRIQKGYKQLEEATKSNRRAFHTEQSFRLENPGSANAVSTLFRAQHRGIVKEGSRLYTKRLTKAHVLTGGQRIMPAADALRVIQKKGGRIMQDPGMPKSAKEQIEKMLEVTSRAENGMLSAQDTAKLLSRASKWSVAKAPPGDAATGRLRDVGREVMDAMDKHMGEAVKSGGLRGEAAKAVEAARNEYRFARERQKALTKLFLGKVRKQEIAGNAFHIGALSKSNLDDIAEGVALMREASPRLLKAYRGAAVEEALLLKPVTAQGRTIMEPQFALKEGQKFWGKHADRMRALYAGDKKTLQAIDDLVEQFRLRQRSHSTKAVEDINGLDGIFKAAKRVGTRFMEIPGQIADREFGALFRTPADISDMVTQMAWLFQPDRFRRLMDSEKGIRLFRDVVTGADAARRGMLGATGGRGYAAFQDWNEDMQELIDMSFQGVEDFETVLEEEIENLEPIELE